MFRRVHIQILDNPAEEIFFSEQTFEDSATNKILADELREEMNHLYPYVVSVEYIDLFMDDERAFPEIRELLRHGAINTPVILINGIPRIYGGIPNSVIRKEVENLLSSGLTH
jgi:hypothetical protein